MTNADNSRHPFTTTPVCMYKSRENIAAAAPLSVLTSLRSAGSGIPGGKIEVSSSLRVINNRYIIGERRGRGNGEKRARGWRGADWKATPPSAQRAAAHLRAAERGWWERRRGRSGGGKRRGGKGFRFTQVYWIYWDEPRDSGQEDISCLPTAPTFHTVLSRARHPLPSSVRSRAPFPSSSSLAFIKIARLIYAAR